MNKKSEINALIVVYILLVIALGATIVFSTGGFNTIKNIETKAEINNFVGTLETSLRNQKLKGIGSVDQISLSLPSGISTICFVDGNEQFSQQTFLELNKEKTIYQDKNLFFFPTEKFAPAKINYIKINGSDNPLCVKALGSRINLRLTTLANSTLVEADQNEITKNCIVVPGSNLGDPSEKIDLVFLGYGYSNKTFFADDVNDYTSNYLFQTEPFLSNKDKFNVWMVDDGEPECTITSYVMCESYSVNKLASNCPNDYVFVLIDKKRTTDRVRSSSISNTAKINTRDNRLVLLHEFGHSFAKLADEYTDSYYESWFDAKNYPNCDYDGCSKWSSVLGTDCIKGCSTGDFYRSVDISIMRNYDLAGTFGVLNEEVINTNLGEYK